MSYDLSSITRSTQLPPRIVCYGVPGIGKTTFAASLPDPVFIPVEDGLGQLDVAMFPRPQTYDDVLDAIAALIDNDVHYRTLVIDSLDKLEPLIWDHVLATAAGGKHKDGRIEDFGYGKGYTHALTEWRKLLDGLDVLREEKGMSICLIAHSHIVRFESPESDPYDRYQLRLHKHAVAAVCDWADAVLFANYEVAVIQTSGSEKKRGVGKGERSLYTSERPAYVAKNRYGMDDRLPLSWDAVSAFIEPAPAPKKVAKKKKATAHKAEVETQDDPPSGSIFDEIPF